MSHRKSTKRHCVKRAKNLVGRLEASWAVALTGLGRLRGYGLLKSRFFVSACPGAVKNRAF